MLHIFGKGRGSNENLAAVDKLETVALSYHEDKDGIYFNQKNIVLLLGGLVEAVWVVDNEAPYAEQVVATYDQNDLWLSKGLTLSQMIMKVLEKPPYKDVYLVTGRVLGGAEFFFDLKEEEGRW